MNRRTLARYVAPAVFLLAVTGVVLVVRSGLRADSKSPAKTTPTLAVTTVARTTTSKPGPSTPKRYYLIKSGDTLDRIAAQFGTTVTDLLRLNPGVQPTALAPGTQIRVQ